MAKYTLYGTARSLFTAYSGKGFAETGLYATSTEFGFTNADGSQSFIRGTGFVWDEAAGKFTGGTVHSISHYSNGAFTDALSGLNLSLAALQQAFESSASPAEAVRQLVFSGNDLIDARWYQVNPHLPTFLQGYGGNDTLRGSLGVDRMFGGSGMDVLSGHAGNDFLNGGIDDDRLYGGDGHDQLVGDGGSDRLYGGEGADAIYGGAGNDSYYGEAGTDTAVYQRLLSEIQIKVASYGFEVIEPSGVDRLNGIERIGTDDGLFVYRAVDHSWVRISDIPGVSLLQANSLLRLTDAGETVHLAGTGFTSVLAAGGNDIIIGASGNDTLLGGDGNDTLTGDSWTAAQQTSSVDRLHGEAGDDRLYGYLGNDFLYGGAGRDALHGGNGNDFLAGGADADAFYFTSASTGPVAEAWGSDVISDFAVGFDHLVLSGNTATSLSLGAEGWVVSGPDGGSILLRGVFTPGLTMDTLLA